MKILVGVDDPPHSRAALEWIKRTAWPTGTRLIVMSVSRPAVVAYSLVDAGGVSYLRAAEEEQVRAHEELAARVEREMGQAGLITEAKVVEGDPRDALVHTAEAEGVDLIVVGSHGRTGLQKLLMGSVASHVVTHAPCSVVVVKLPAGAAKAA